MKKFIDDLGISAHPTLCEWCARFGMTPPTLEEFVAAVPSLPSELVSSPQEGIVVIEPTETIVPEGTGVDDDNEGLGTQKKSSKRRNKDATLAS